MYVGIRYNKFWIRQLENVQDRGNDGINSEVRPQCQASFDRKGGVLRTTIRRNPNLDNLKSVSKLTTVNVQYFYSRYVGIVCLLALPPAPRVVIFLEFGAEPHPRLTRMDTTKKQRARRPHTTSNSYMMTKHLIQDQYRRVV